MAISVEDCKQAPNSLFVINTTGQKINFALVKVKRDDSGNPVMADGKYTIESVSDVTVIPPSDYSGSNSRTVVGGWGPNISPGYDGYTAQTEDGKYSITAAKSGAIATPNAFGYNEGPDCYNAWIGLCTSDGCVYANGTAATYGGAFIMKTDGDYYVQGPRIKLIILVVLLLVAAVAAVFGAAYYYKKKGNPFA